MANEGVNAAQLEFLGVIHHGWPWKRPNRNSQLVGLWFGRGEQDYSIWHQRLPQIGGLDWRGPPGLRASGPDFAISLSQGFSIPKLSGHCLADQELRVPLIKAHGLPERRVGTGGWSFFRVGATMASVFLLVSLKTTTKKWVPGYPQKDKATMLAHRAKARKIRNV